MKTQLTLTAAIAFLTAISIGGDVLADPPSYAGKSKFAVTMPFVNVGEGGLDLALCADADGDDQCDNAVAFITKTGTGEFGFPASSLTVPSHSEFA